MNLIKYWYNLEFVKCNIIKYTYNREFALAYPKTSKRKNVVFSRNLRLHNTKHLDFFCKKYDLYNKRLNWYYSLAEYKYGLPRRNFNHGDYAIFEKWKKIHWKYMLGFDFVIDIDRKHDAPFKYVLISAKMIKDFLDLRNFQYQIRFSGNGFHFLIPYKYFTSFNPDPYSEHSVYKYFYSIALKLHNTKTEMVDLRMYDSRRLIKLPYTLTFYKDVTYVCSPCNLYDFKLDDYRPENFIKNGTTINN